ncbi:MAG: GNAT family N-acetyltransferase [Desulfurococcales archaeon]|nr:GNAT family N-acetyltransferase [Desulfurococcales archaeon]
MAVTPGAGDSCSPQPEASLEVKARVEGVIRPSTGYRWYGSVLVRAEGIGRVALLMTGSIAQWLRPGEQVVLASTGEPHDFAGGLRILEPGEYTLTRLTSEGPVLVWPPWCRLYEVKKPYYHGVVMAREASSESDYEAVAGLEQYHYASKEELVAIWKCPRCGTVVEANTRPKCPKCGARMILQEIRGSLPSSRFLVLELLTRKPYEPRIIGYVRVDTPIPLMHRRIPTPDGGFRVEKLIREKVFPPDWFHPTFWPIKPPERRKILCMYRELAPIYGRRLARAIVGSRIAEEALARANTAAARIARVVVHPDFRGGGIGVLAVRAALDWIRGRRVPEMRRRKHIVETIAAMARYNPFFERAGFRYVWDTASGRPVLMYPLSEEARRRLEEFLAKDPVASRHGGILYRPRYKPAPPLSAPIRFRDVSKGYSSELSLEGLPAEVAEALRAFGVERRVVERRVIDEANITIEPGDIVAVVGASGAGKTTLLRLVIGALDKAYSSRPEYRPDSGEVEAPPNPRLAALIPGEIEPEFGGGSLLEEITRITGNVQEALEVLSISGISDAVLYRARFWELSTGQRERAKIAALLASKPNILVIDEFMAHLDPTTARWVAGRIARIAREHGMTVVAATHRREVVEALQPSKILVVGYGKIVEVSNVEEAL